MGENEADSTGLLGCRVLNGLEVTRTPPGQLCGSASVAVAVLETNTDVLAQDGHTFLGFYRLFDRKTSQKPFWVSEP